MPSLAKILVPIDFSERSIGAARCALALAARFDSQITLLHVLLATPYGAGFEAAGGAMVDEWLRNRGTQAAQDLDSFLAGEWQGLAVDRIVIEGDPSAQIVDFAHRNASDLIVMPTHGYGPFRRFIIGSNAAKVLHDADCPVWTGIHMPESPSADQIAWRHILCAVDLGPQSERTLAWAAWMAQVCRSRLSLIHALACTSESEGEWRSHVRETVQEELLRVQTNLGSQADVLVEAGEPSHVICAAAARIKAGLLVIGRGSAAGVFGRLRTNAYAIIRQSPCPVVSV
jgi:nucleotide-binding universal stress UspA family protein